MPKDQYTSTKQALEAFYSVPSYLERFAVSVEIEEQEPLSNDVIFCLSCSSVVADESHECSKAVR